MGGEAVAHSSVESSTPSLDGKPGVALSQQGSICHGHSRDAWWDRRERYTVPIWWEWREWKGPWIGMPCWWVRLMGYRNQSCGRQNHRITSWIRCRWIDSECGVHTRLRLHNCSNIFMLEGVLMRGWLHMWKSHHQGRISLYYYGTLTMDWVAWLGDVESVNSVSIGLAPLDAMSMPDGRSFAPLESFGIPWFWCTASLFPKSTQAFYRHFLGAQRDQHPGGNQHLQRLINGS